MHCPESRWPPRPAVILLIDDSEARRYILRRLLEREGCEVWEARTGTEGLLLAADGPDAVVLDVRLPDLDGLEVCRQLKAGEHTRRIPVIHLSAVATRAQEQAAGLDIGADAYLTDPVEPQVLMATLRAVLRTQADHEADYTGRRRAESALKESEERFRLAVESTGAFVYDWDIPGGRLEWFGGIDRSLGYGDHEIPRTLEGWERLLHPEDRQRVLDHIRAALGSGSHFTDEYRVLRTDGTVRYWSERGSVLRNAAGEAYRWIGAVEDITERKLAEEAMRASEERFRALVQNSSDILTLLDADGTIRYESPAVLPILGFQPHELIGRNAFELIHPDDRERVVWAYENGGLHQRLEYRFQHRDGTWRYLDSIGTDRLEDPRIRAVVVNSRDITERREAEEQLRQAITGARCLLWRGDVELHGPGIRWNARVTNPEASLEFLPLELPDGLGFEAAFHSAILPEDRVELEPALRRALTEGRESFVGEFRCRTRDGLRWLSLDARLQPLTADRWQMTAICTDISERKRAEQERELRDRAISAASQGIIITDPGRPDNPIIYCNRAFEEVTGYSADEVLGRNCRFLQGPETDPAARAEMKAAVETGTAATVEILNYRKDGTPFWNAVSISPIRDVTGRVTHFVGVQNDVTARRNLEEQFRQSQKMEAVGRLAGGVAHDFNNMLAVINGYSEILMERQDLDPFVASALREIHAAGNRAAGLTRQLLTFSRKQVLSTRVVDLNEVVSGIEKMVRRLIGEDVEMALSLSPDTGQIEADRGQIEQILLNLVVNARDALPTGGRIEVQTRAVEVDAAYAAGRADLQPGRYCLLAVTDNGIGMEAATLHRIFEPFFTTKEQGRGTGLGLATVYGIVQQSVGHIEVSSSPGRGASFRILLPQVDATTEAGETPPTAGGGAGETILLVEDEEAVRRLVADLLKLDSYRVLEAADPEHALRLASEAETLDVLLTDVVMPRMSGRELAEQVQRARPGTRVLYMSGYTDDEVIRRGVFQDGAGFLHKPFTAEALRERLRQVLTRSNRPEGETS